LRGAKRRSNPGFFPATRENRDCFAALATTRRGLPIYPICGVGEIREWRDRTNECGGTGFFEEAGPRSPCPARSGKRVLLHPFLHFPFRLSVLNSEPFSMIENVGLWVTQQIPPEIYLETAQVQTNFMN
jgi:hypothetical protein